MRLHMGLVLHEGICFSLLGFIPIIAWHFCCPIANYSSGASYLPFEDSFFCCSKGFSSEK
jgi:hypothetical protein